MPGSSIGTERVSKLWEAFCSMDADGNGVISSEELALVMRELEEDVSPGNIRQLIDEVDLDGSGTIDFDEFQALMISARGDHEARRRVAFEVLDVSHTGKVDLADLEPVMLRFGLGSDELKRMIALVDADGDGALDFDEFTKLLPAPADETSTAYQSTPALTPRQAPDYVHDPSRFENTSLQEDAASGNPEAIERISKLLHKQADEWQVQQRGTSLLQLQTGIFRLLQGAAYRCFRESFSANYETHLRVQNLPYRIADFVEFTKLTLEMYKGLGVVHPDCFPVIDALKDSLASEFARLEDRIAHWDTVPKTEGMLAEARRVEATANESKALTQKFAAGIEYAITLRKQKLSVADAVEGVLARHELNRLRQIDLQNEMDPNAPAARDPNARAYLERWNRVILSEAGEQIPGAMMPAAYWYEEFMPRLLAAVSVATPEDARECSSPDEAALDAWYDETRASGTFDRYGGDVAEHFPSCTAEQKLAIRQAWRLTEHYLNGVQKRREREEFGRETGALSQYAAFLDVYLGRTYVRDADMRVSFPYYIGPMVWRLLHTSAEIVCEMSLERQNLALKLFVSFFELFATMYPCPYCRHHLNAYVVQNREVMLYPLEYLVLGHDPSRTELQMSANEKLRGATTGPELRLFFWKLHNTVNASIARQEAWYQRDERAFYTTRYWPSLDSELARAYALNHISLSTERIARIYGLLKPAARLAGLRAELQHLLTNGDEDDLRRICDLGNRYVAELETAVLGGHFLQDTYRFNPDRVDPPPSYSAEEEEFARSGVFTE